MYVSLAMIRDKRNTLKSAEGCDYSSIMSVASQHKQSIVYGNDSRLVGLLGHFLNHRSSVVAAAEYPKIRDADWSIQILS